jgi:hypothetical protein
MTTGRVADLPAGIFSEVSARRVRVLGNGLTLSPRRSALNLSVTGALLVDPCARGGAHGALQDGLQLLTGPLEVLAVGLGGDHRDAIGGRVLEAMADQPADVEHRLVHLAAESEPRRAVRDDVQVPADRAGLVARGGRVGGDEADAAASTTRGSDLDLVAR